LQSHVDSAGAPLLLFGDKQQVFADVIFAGLIGIVAQMLAEFTKGSTVRLDCPLGLSGQLKVFSESLNERALRLFVFGHWNTP
jgi:hypothetical protein